ncbi:MAG: nuclear transport factor 2 family protein [Methanomassiliicoccales archaeon]|nr:nuclear transport factor 2 family protein [Methanomassiliicoccales archaeon]
MSERENVEIVQRLFAALGRRDIQAMRDALADDVKWQSPVTGTEHRGITWSRARQGKDEVMAFFGELSQKSRIEPFTDLIFTAQDNRVVVEGRNRGTALSTGRTYCHDWVMIFLLRDGKICEQRHYYDTADIESAFIDG